MQAKHKPAKEAYEQLLAEKQLTPQLRADIYRQLGWMYHSLESLGEKRQRESFAIHCLQRSIEASAKSGQSLYLLGRCYASLNKVHDAFIAYRNSVEKSEGNADTWCSIGVLYQQQNQPMDALQAYICAVQLDKTHKAAWTNLGILYESCSQPRDAFACYMNATRITNNNNNSNSGNNNNNNNSVNNNSSNNNGSSGSNSNNNNNTSSNSGSHAHNKESGVDENSGLTVTGGSGQPLHQPKPTNLQARIKFLQTQLSHAPMPSITSKRRQLPSIEEAWNVPISAEMSSRQQAQSSHSQANTSQQQRQQQQKSNSNVNSSNSNVNSNGNQNNNGGQQQPPPYPNATTGPAIPAKRMRPGEVPPGGATIIAPPTYLTQQQLQMLQTLQQNQNNLTPPQQNLLQQLTNEYRLMQQHVKQQQQMQQQQRLQQQQQQQQLKQNGGFVNGGGGFAGNHQPQTAAQYPSTGGNTSNFTQSSPTPGSTNQQDMGVSDMELQAILSQTDITTTAENLLKQFGSSAEDLPGGAVSAIKQEECGVISGGSGSGEVVVEGSNTVAGSGSAEKPKITNKIKLENGTLKSTTTVVKREKSKSPHVKVEKVTPQEDEVEEAFTIDMDAKRINELCK